MKGRLLFRADCVGMPYLDHQQDPMGAHASHDKVGHEPAASDPERLLGLHGNRSAQIHKTGKGSPRDPGMEQTHQSFARLQLHCKTLDRALVRGTTRITWAGILLRAPCPVPLA
ncbi:hypothetical protein [Variovorax sp. AFSI2.2]|uniref:hypothetical protein n=1 Tax=Variovorax sp. AFSI2.2 TaxID=3384160 RepID=UPI003EC09715